MPAPEIPTRQRRNMVLARLLQGWHRSAGVAAALFLVFLGITGVLLMHSDRLGLPTRQVESRWLLDWYGIRPAPPARGIERDGHWFSESAGRIFFDTIELPFSAGVLLGAFRTAPGTDGGEWLVVTDVQAMVVDDNGVVLERFGRESGLPASLTAAGLDTSGRVVLAGDGAHFRFDPTTGESVAAAADGAVDWSRATNPPSTIAAAIARNYSGEGVSIERVLLDLHSGRLFGTLGVVAVNLAALLLCFLAASGLYLWSRRTRGGRTH